MLRTSQHSIRISVDAELSYCLTKFESLSLNEAIFQPSFVKEISSAECIVELYKHAGICKNTSRRTAENF